ncbi:MAG: hypothetical protein ACM3SY_13875 [Candidatus Omnitrophota bacterium]
MSNLKKQNMNKCLSLLQEFVNNAEAGNNQKMVAALALDQLKKIAAGSDPGLQMIVASTGCNGIARIDY